MRMSVMTLFVLLVLGVLAFGQSKSIEGVWVLKAITTTGPNGSTKQITQPSIYLFTKKHYSIIYVSSADPRPEVTLDTASAEELRKVFVEDFIANAGTYETKGGKITFRPMVAKSPGFMKSGTFQTSTYKAEGNTMTLVAESSNNGPAVNPMTFKLTRVE